MAIAMGITLVDDCVSCSYNARNFASSRVLGFVARDIVIKRND